MAEDAADPGGAVTGVVVTGVEAAGVEATEPPPVVERATPGRRHGVAVGALLAGVLGLVAAGGVLVAAVVGLAGEDAGRRDALAAGRQGVLNLLSVTPATVEADVERVLSGSTGRFLADFTGSREMFVQIVKEQQVTSVGEIGAAGVDTTGSGTATVLVAANSRVSNTRSPDGEERDYRLRVSLERVAGAWLLADVEFVP